MRGDPKMTALLHIKSAPIAERAVDADRLLECWQEGRSPRTLLAYTRDLQNFATWLMAHNALRSI
jgi:hypothetical protein